MTTPIDTTRLRAPITDNVLTALREMIKWGPHPIANATAYNALPALLDEVERLRAWVAPPVESEHAEDTREWCWRKAGSDTCQGPFGTREEAIHDARYGWEEAGPIEVGRCTPPMDALGTPTADEMRERVNDSLCDEGLDAHAIIMDEPAANAALRESGKAIQALDESPRPAGAK